MKRVLELVVAPRRLAQPVITGSIRHTRCTARPASAREPARRRSSAAGSRRPDQRRRRPRRPTAAAGRRGGRRGRRARGGEAVARRLAAETRGQPAAIATAIGEVSVVSSRSRAGARPRARSTQAHAEHRDPVEEARAAARPRPRRCASRGSARRRPTSLRAGQSRPLRGRGGLRPDPLTPARRVLGSRHARLRLRGALPHVDRYTPDDRTDRPALGAVHGERGTLLVEGGASVAHLGAFAAELAARGRPPVIAIALTHWHWDHSFGSAAIAAPVIAHARHRPRSSAVQAGYDWSDAALDERVARRPRDRVLRATCPASGAARPLGPRDRRPDRDVHERRTSTSAASRRRSSTSAATTPPTRAWCTCRATACSSWATACTSACTRLSRMLTIAGVRALLDKLSRFDVAVAVEGHDDDVDDTAGLPPGWPSCGTRPTWSRPGRGAAAAAAGTRTWPSWWGSCSSARDSSSRVLRRDLQSGSHALRQITGTSRMMRVWDDCGGSRRRERAAHWLVACAFGVMLFSGGQVPHRWAWTTPALDVHVGAAVVLVCGLAGLLLFGNGRSLSRTARELRSLDADDRAWLAPLRILRGRPAPPVGRFNAGQKMNARLALLGLVGLYATGAYLVIVGRSAFGHLHGPFGVPDHRPDRRAHLHGRGEPVHPACPARDDARERRPRLGRAPLPPLGGRDGASRALICAKA